MNLKTQTDAAPRSLKAALVPEAMKPLARAPFYAARSAKARLLAQVRPTPSRESPPPIFIIGCGRSGTSLLGELFSTHQSVSYFFEPYHLWAAIDPATDFLQQYSHGEYHCLLGASTATARSARKFHRLMSPEPGRTLVEKSPINALRIGYLDALVPGARFVHIVRDGVDVVRSIERKAASSRRLAFRPRLNDWWGVGDAKWSAMEREGQALGYFPDEVVQLRTHAQRGAYEWLLSLHEVEKQRAFLGARLIELRYQDLLDEPEDTLKQVMASLGLPAPDSWLAQATAQVKPSGSSYSGRLALPTRMCGEFNSLQERFGFRGRAEPAGDRHT